MGEFHGVEEVDGADELERHFFDLVEFEGAVVVVFLEVVG